MVTAPSTSRYPTHSICNTLPTHPPLPVNVLIMVLCKNCEPPPPYLIHPPTPPLNRNHGPPVSGFTEMDRTHPLAQCCWHSTTLPPAVQAALLIKPNTTLTPSFIRIHTPVSPIPPD
eukprot:714785-Hanusia_phi.AAC.2